MKTKLSLLLLLVAFARLSAQDTCFPYNAGGFGHFFTGPAALTYGDLRTYLERSDVLHTNLPARPGTMSGGEGMALLGRFLIGGGGFGQTVLRQTTDSARLNMSFGGGYFKFGYVCCYKNSNFTYAYGGVGWGGLNVHLENLSDESFINFNHRLPLSPGFKRDYSLAYNFYDVGVSFKHLFMSNKRSDGDGGFMIGLDLGCMVAISTGDWVGRNDEVVSGPPVQGASWNPYLRLTIGGGGFGVK